MNKRYFLKGLNNSSDLLDNFEIKLTLSVKMITLGTVTLMKKLVNLIYTVENIMFRNNTIVITDPWCNLAVDDHPSMENYIEESADKDIEYQCQIWSN